MAKNLPRARAVKAEAEGDAGVRFRQVCGSFGTRRTGHVASLRSGYLTCGSGQVRRESFFGVAIRLRVGMTERRRHPDPPSPDGPISCNAVHRWRFPHSAITEDHLRRLPRLALLQILQRPPGIPRPRRPVELLSRQAMGECCTK